MIQIDIQEFGVLKLEHFVTDYSGECVLTLVEI
jgi:hypothetical protein